MLEVVPLAPGFAAEVRGVDLAGALQDGAGDTLRRALIDHKVIRLRGQSLTPEIFIAASRLFGKPDLAPPGECANKNLTLPGYPEVVVISNARFGDLGVGALGSGELEWHTDMSYVPNPPSASILYAVKVPATGGETEFLDMTQAYETLPGDLEAVCRDLEAFHSAAHTSAGTRRDAEDDGGAIHPIVLSHPESGCPALYLGRRKGGYLVGARGDDEELLARIWSHSVACGATWLQKWREGDVLVWYNRCVMHRRNAFSTGEARVMYRTQVLAG